MQYIIVILHSVCVWVQKYCSLSTAHPGVLAPCGAYSMINLNCLNIVSSLHLDPTSVDVHLMHLRRWIIMMGKNIYPILCY